MSGITTLIRKQRRRCVGFPPATKIDEGFKQKLIHTVRGVGYVLKAS